MIRLRLTLLATAAAAALAVASPADASAPYWTQKPELFVQGGRLFVSNGGWSSNSGTPTKVAFRFLRDGVVVKGLRGAVPQSTQPHQFLPNVAPDDSGAQYYALSAADAGRCFVAQAWGGIRSTYRTADGSLLYDVWEWGHLNSFGAPAVTNQVCVGRDGLAAAAPAPVADAPLSVVPSVLSASANAPYSGRIGVAGGGAGFTFRAVADSLPRGVTLSPDGTVSGSPDMGPGQYPFTVAVSHPSGLAGTVELVFTILPARMAFAARPLPTATRGRLYRARFVVTGGSAPYRFRIVDSRLPRGLRLLATGVVTGRAAHSGRFRFTVEARDATGMTVRKQYTLLVRRR